MIFYILLVLVILGGLVAILHGFFSEYGDIALGFFVGVIFIWGFGGLVVTAGTYAIDKYSDTVKRDTTTSLAALGNSSSISGSFFLGSGYVKDNLTYTYLIEDSNGGIHLKQLDASNAVVYQDAEVGKATLVTHQGGGDLWWLFPEKTTFHNISYEFHVPKGSVDNQYQVNVSGK